MGKPDEIEENEKIKNIWLCEAHPIVGIRGMKKMQKLKIINEKKRKMAFCFAKPPLSGKKKCTIGGIKWKK